MTRGISKGLIFVLFIVVSIIAVAMPGQPVYAADTDDISASFTDANFKQAVWEWLGNSGDPGSFTKEDLIDRRRTKGDILNVSNRNISNLAGIENFQGVGILTLDCSYNQIKYLPYDLPRLWTINCQNNQLSNLPDFPDYLHCLNISNNRFTYLSYINGTLNELDCSGNQLTELPELPNLTVLHCSDNQITTLPDLPRIEILYCGNNPLTSLPSTLPHTLDLLSCEGDQLTSLPPLPYTIKTMYCSANQLTNLNSLPSRLLVLDCSDNTLKSLPKLPSDLTQLVCDANQLTNLPELPGTLTSLKCSDNLLTAMPTLPTGLEELSCRGNYLNVFTGDLKNGIDALTGLTSVDMIPQYRFLYLSGPITLGSNRVYQLSGADFKKQSTLNGTDWTDEDVTIDAADFTYESSNIDVANANISGLIGACGPGNCDIYALYKGTDSEYTKMQIPITVNSTGGANLVVELENPPSSLGAGEKVPITVLITNNGDAESVKNMLQIKIGDQILASRTISKIKPGRNKKVKFKIIVPIIQGTYTLAVSLTSNNGDAYPGLNQVENNVTVELPDLDIFMVTAKKALAPGKSGTLTVTILNRNISTARNFVIRVYWQKTSPIGEKMVPKLVGRSKNISISVKVPKAYDPDEDVLLIVADADNQVIEENEYNNRAGYMV